MARYIGERYPKVKIIARARDRQHVYELYAAGVPDSVREVFDSAVRAGKLALAALGHDAGGDRGHGRGVRARRTGACSSELAALWQPGVPAEENPAYLPRRASRAR